MEANENIQNILRGLENNEFKMYLQFIVDNKTKKIVAAEGLSRWISKEKGVIGPGNYISIMEDTGLITRHDFYMFSLACRQLEKWQNTLVSETKCDYIQGWYYSKALPLEECELFANSYSA